MSPLHCPSPNRNPAPLHIPKNLEDAKALIKRGNCYLSGAGVNNKLTAGIVHTVRAPALSIYQYQTESGDLFGVHREALSSRSAKTNLVLKFLNVNGLKTTATAVEEFIQTYPDLKDGRTELGLKIARLKEELEIIRPAVKASANATSGTEHGDSGGPMICLDVQKKPYLIGIITNADQEITLINDLRIQSWREGLGAINTKSP